MIFGIRKLESPGYCMACLRDSVFSLFDRTSTAYSGPQHIPR